mmetsp:Transcript_78988/g.218627  ORF Transcript_78988/g.218627 Transcript_78988/m.218627 type:complete len:522 (+) Transcript_78988:72-1637(+)
MGISSPWRLPVVGSACRRRRLAAGREAMEEGKEEAEEAAPKRRRLGCSLAVTSAASLAAAASGVLSPGGGCDTCGIDPGGLGEGTAAMLGTIAALGSADLLRFTVALARRHWQTPAAAPELPSVPLPAPNRSSDENQEASGGRRGHHTRVRVCGRGRGGNVVPLRTRARRRPSLGAAALVPRAARAARREVWHALRHLRRQGHRERQQLRLHGELATLRAEAAGAAARHAVATEQCAFLQERYATVVALLEHRTREVAELRVARQAGTVAAPAKAEPSSPSSTSRMGGPASTSVGEATGIALVEDFEYAPSTPSAHSWRGVLRRGASGESEPSAGDSGGPRSPLGAAAAAASPCCSDGFDTPLGSVASDIPTPLRIGRGAAFRGSLVGFEAADRCSPSLAPAPAAPPASWAASPPRSSSTGLRMQLAFPNGVVEELVEEEDEGNGRCQEPQWQRVERTGREEPEREPSGGSALAARARPKGVKEEQDSEEESEGEFSDDKASAKAVLMSSLPSQLLCREGQ